MNHPAEAICPVPRDIARAIDPEGIPLDPEFVKLCKLAGHYAAAVMLFNTGKRGCKVLKAQWLVPVGEMPEFHRLLMKFKSDKIWIRRFARGPRHSRASTSPVATAHSFAYYYQGPQPKRNWKQERIDRAVRKAARAAKEFFRKEAAMLTF